MNVLVVDDDPINLKLLCATLEQEGHTVVQAQDGIWALEALERCGADAIISDILMPRMDGNRLCHEVRKSERFKKIPFIAYSATYTSVGDEKLSLDLGADIFLRKPAPAAQIFDALQKATSRRRDGDAQLRITMPEGEVMKEYNEQLVNKLEKRNSELALTNDQLHELTDKLAQKIEELEKLNAKFEREIVERTNAQEARKRLEQEILEISDHEQRRIGSDLHDDLCQRLAGIRFSCDALKSSLNNSPADTSARVDKIATAVSEAIDRARMLAHGLSPVALESDGLVSALQELTNGVQKLFGIECTFESKGKITLPNAMAGTHLYRIAQEAINNALKHGHASQLLVAVERVGDQAALTIHDNGAGFSVDEQQSQGLGLRTISYRAGLIGAALQVKSKPGQGTTIVCTFSPNP